MCSWYHARTIIDWGKNELVCYNARGLYDGKPPTGRRRLIHTRIQERKEPTQTAPSGPLLRPASWAGVNRAAARGNSPRARHRCVRRPPPSMGLGDIILYAFCAFIVGVFIFNLVDTAQTAKRKIAAKKHD